VIEFLHYIVNIPKPCYNINGLFPYVRCDQSYSCQ
jgi:hypothetical protein